MSNTPSRNEPCPCGSGTKYKYCCLNKPRNPKTTVPLTWIAGGLAVAAVAALVVLNRPEPAAAGAAETPGAPSIGDSPQRSGEAWEYDAETDMHWHPGHAHWHPGPPPENQAPAAGPPARTGSAWEYDAETDMHWHPGHAHWHPGPPPEQEN